MHPEGSCPVVVLASGQTLRLRRVMLYDADAIAEIAALRAHAAKGLGMQGTGIGILGTPSLGFAAEAAAMFAVSGLLANAAQKTALEYLKSAGEKYEKLSSHGIYFGEGELNNLHTPRPDTWFAFSGTKVQVVDMNKWSRTEIDQFLQRHNKSKRDLNGWTVQISVPIKYVHSGDEFLNVATDVGYMSIRWSNVAAYLPPQRSEN